MMRVLLVGGLVVVAWFGMVRLFASMSGWRRLADKYAFAPPEHLSWSRVSGIMGGVQYRGVLVAFADDFVYLRVPSLLMPFHAPLRIPRAILHRRAIVVPVDYCQVKYHVDDPPIATLGLSRDLETRAPIPRRAATK